MFDVVTREQELINNGSSGHGVRIQDLDSNACFWIAVVQFIFRDFPVRHQTDAHWCRSGFGRLFELTVNLVGRAPGNHHEMKHQDRG